MPPTDNPEIDAALAVIADEWNWSPEMLRALLKAHSDRATAATLPPTGSDTVVFDGPLEGGPLGSAASPEVMMPDRYEDLGRIGQGAMGEVRRVRDRHLQRTLAMKVIHTGIMVRPTLSARFQSEARSTARLQHPGIVPVHDMGILPDGRAWFTMKEVKGKELEEVIRDSHAVRRTQQQTTSSGWTLRRIIEAFRRVCETMAFAHSRGFIHRDLKPSNLMVGEHGEVMVLDWGIAKQLRQLRSSDAKGSLPHDVQSSNWSMHQPTQMGAVAGTPAYMAPEQARGEIDKLDARTDVYALGAVLYHILSGRPPYTEHPGSSILTQVLAGPPSPLSSPHSERRSEGPHSPLPEVLVELCNRAMAREPAHRPQSADELAQGLNAWLDGVQRRARAHELITRARDQRARSLQLQAEALKHRRDAEDALRGVQSWQPEEDRHEGWEHQDAAATLEREATLLNTESERLLQASLTHAPDLPETHAALAATYRAQHEAAEAQHSSAHRSEAFLEQHLSALPPTDPRRAAHRSYLTGNGSLTLLTDQPGAHVVLHRHEVIRKRYRLGAGTPLGETPLLNVSIPMGSYTCEVRHHSRDAVRYPIFIERGQSWSGIAPDAHEPTPIHLPAQRSPEEIYIPAGWFRAGAADGFVNRYPPQWIWCDAMLMMRDQVSNAEYCAYLNHLLAAGDPEAVQRAMPTVSPTADNPWTLHSGRVVLQSPHADHSWTPDHPVHFINWIQATAYTQWYAAQTGLPWRLPHELEWEKAARGVDGRQYPWGDAFCPAWCHVAGSVQQASGPSRIGAFPADLSPYGVRGMAGNVMDWCADIFQTDRISEPLGRVPVAPPMESPVDREVHRVLRGGAWCYNSKYAMLTARGRGRPVFSSNFTGFRLVRSLEDGPRRT